MEIAFASNHGPTLGVELELALVDASTGALVREASTLLHELGEGWPGGDHPKAKHELFDCTIEIITGVCTTVAEAKADLTATLHQLRAVAEPRGIALMSAGSHPFSSWRDQRVSPSDRYAELLEEMQWTGRRLLIFGTHIHVGVRSPEKAVAIVNALPAYLPLLLLLSASSPYWEREDSGLASARIKVFESLPTAGLPPQLSGWSQFEELMGTLIAANCIKTIREVWWDIRPHPGFGTVELRMCDACSTLRETAALAALGQCLVAGLDELYDGGRFPDPPREWVVRENKWLAARHGIDAELIVDEAGARRPARELVSDLVQQLGPVAERLDCVQELADVDRIATHGPSYVRQRTLAAGGASPADIVFDLVRQLDSDRPSPDWADS